MGLVTKRVAEAVSPTGLPVAMIVYDPFDTLPTVNDPVRVPADIAHDCEPTATPPLSEHTVSFSANPEPDTWSVAPGTVEGVFSVMSGGL